MEVKKTNKIMHLPDGEYLLRALTPDDYQCLHRFFTSPEGGFHLRYGQPVNVWDEADIKKLFYQQPQKNYAIALLEVSKEKEAIHAIGRYYINAEETHADVTFVVRESKRQLGCSTCLMQELIRTARSRGLKVLQATVEPLNTPMLKILYKFGFQEISKSAEEIKLELKLSNS